MAASLDHFVELATIAPFVAAIAAPFLFRVLGANSAWLLALVPAAIFAFLVTLIPEIAGGTAIETSLPWVPSDGIDLSFRIDGLSLLFALTIAGIGVLIVLYSGAYLKGHPQQGRFLGFMLAFMGAMLGLVLADGLIPLYAFWELTAVTSYLLIGFDHTRALARRGALQALIVTGLGGLALLLGVVLLRAVTGQWNLSAMTGQRAEITQSGFFLPIAVLIFLAAFTKSAQFPFHFWLPNAMEAPTPVSAYLHSATMVQAGIYLLARLSPLLGGNPVWTATLMIFGGVTMAWGSLGALRQTDLKQILAQSTIASLGLLTLLLGMGGEVATVAAVVYFLAHALYKAGFFLVAGLIDHETGSRDITSLVGLRDRMALSFIAAILAGLSMLGLPPALGYLAKEQIYGALGPLQWAELPVPLLLVGGNAAMGTLALMLVIKPFAGPLAPTPKSPHEGPFAMLVGPLALGTAGIAGAALSGWLATSIVGPAVAVVTGKAAEIHLGLAFDPANPALWLSLATWALAALIYWKLEPVRTLLRPVDAALGWSFDRGFDAMMAGLLALAHGFAGNWQNGRLRFYLAALFAASALSLILPLILLHGLPAPPALPVLEPVEWAAIVLAIVGVGAVILARTLLIAIVSLGVQGLAIALIYLLFGAPDLGFTQFMVETLSVVMLALVMTRLRLDRHPGRSAGVALRDGVLSLLLGGGLTAALLAVLGRPMNTRLSDFFAANAAAVAHGRNIVNVILVDFRGLDTLGEISVVLTTGVAVLALMAAGRKAPTAGPHRPRPSPQPRQRRSARRGAATS